MTRPRLALMASGRGSNVVAVLEAIADGSVSLEPVVVITDKPEAPVVQEAAIRDVAALVIAPHPGERREAYGARLLHEWEAHRIDVVALAGFMRILSPSVIEAFPGWIFNIHPSLLPSFPGLHSVRQALAYGVCVSGCTVHIVDAGVDTGPIVLQAAVPVLEKDTEEELAARILAQEHILYPEALRLYAEDRLTVTGRKVRIHND